MPNDHADYCDDSRKLHDLVQHEVFGIFHIENMGTGDRTDYLKSLRDIGPEDTDAFLLLPITGLFIKRDELSAGSGAGNVFHQALFNNARYSNATKSTTR